MVFNSFIFWVIFPLIFLVYWIIPKRFNTARKIWLLMVSYLLYLNWNPFFSLVLLYVTAVTYFGAISISSKFDKRRKKALIICLAVLTLIPLLAFKYYNFLNDNITALMVSADIKFSLPGLNWAVPVGISFFTFQALGYMFDVYRDKIEPERNLADYMLFCSFFPQTASGPISKAGELLPQFKKEREFRFSDGAQGLKYVLWGIFLKCFVADRLGLYVDTVFSNYQHFSALNCFWASVLFSLQIYGDFAGYSLMAVGIAKTLGFDLINNFRRPYFADSITNFWRRWHISLTRWLTEHVYIPLGGSRCSKPKQYANIMTTFLVSGLWHGANWTFIVWGGIHGIAQIVEKHLGIDPKGRHAGKAWYKKTKVIRIIITFLVVTFAWIIFRMPTIGDAYELIARIFSGEGSQPFMYKASNSDKMLTFLAIALLFAAELRGEYLRSRTTWLDRPWARWSIYVGIFCIILCMGVLDASSFIYVNF